MGLSMNLRQKQSNGDYLQWGDPAKTQVAIFAATFSCINNINQVKITTLSNK